MRAAFDESYRLEDRYTRPDGRVYLTGTQALVRLLLEQAAHDRSAGRRTAGFVSGYRGSPLGGVDRELWRAASLLERAGIRFQPAVNEELAATAVMGTQQVEADPHATVEGVFALWYGKGPGLDRAGDALKHGNAYGSSPHGGVLVVAGDDHGCVSSSMSFQSDQAMMAWSMPVLHPASIAEYVGFGLWGFACSRVSGAWIGFKAISETVESAASVPLERPRFVVPAGFVPPPGGLHNRWPDYPSPAIEARLQHKLAAVRAFAAANPIDRIVVAPERPRLLVVTVGKAHGDVMEALRVGGLGPERLAAEGVAILKLGLVFPIDPGIRALAEGIEEILVVEEKGPVVETQLKDLLYNVPADRRPRIAGKADETGAPLVPITAELRPSRVAPVLASRLARLGLGLDIPEAWSRAPEPAPSGPVRTPYFCSGCPHNASTRVPEGSRAFAGIGCHFMASWMGRNTGRLVQMGGEGVNWVGRAPFTQERHVFQNLGDGTYYHSGLLAIRAAVAAGVNVTYKILFNDAVAMTGGQQHDGPLNPHIIAEQIRAEGVARIAVVSDAPDKYTAGFPAGTTVHHRDDLDAVQRELREVPGVSALIYDQTCAAEKRRRRKRGTYPDPAKRVVINELVCEGCGDCQTKSNCLSVAPVETEFGRKRRIDQSSCNKDFSCVQGFCPSFVTVEGGALKRRAGALSLDELQARAALLPEPGTAHGETPFEILIAGVGGTGIVTLGAVIGMAAHLEGRGASVLDFAGFAQKGGPVLCHVRLAPDPMQLHQVRIDRGRADAVLACDLVVTAGAEALGVVDKGRTRVVANAREIPTGAMLRDPSARIDTHALETLLRQRVADYRSFDAQALVERLVGDAAQANMLLLGAAWQSGLVPVSRGALRRAIELNGVAVEANERAFAWGRLAAADPDFVAGFLGDTQPPARTLDEIVARRAAFLTDYQDAGWAARYRARVEAVRAAERRVFGEAAGEFAEAVARNLFKLMAYKDEYEVARLYGSGFLARIADEFEGPARLTFHLAPPLLSRPRPGESEPRKLAFGPWMLGVFRVLARLKGLRGTVFDPFGWTAERREERRLIAEYEAMVDALLPLLSRATLGPILALARTPESIRGFGPVKARAVAEAARRKTEHMAELGRILHPDVPSHYAEAAE